MIRCKLRFGRPYFFFSQHMHTLMNILLINCCEWRYYLLCTIKIAFLQVEWENLFFLWVKKVDHRQTITPWIFLWFEWVAAQDGSYPRDIASDQVQTIKMYANAYFQCIRHIEYINNRCHYTDFYNILFQMCLQDDTLADFLKPDHTYLGLI